MHSRRLLPPAGWLPGVVAVQMQNRVFPLLVVILFTELARFACSFTSLARGHSTHLRYKGFGSARSACSQALEKPSSTADMAKLDRTLQQMQKITITLKQEATASLLVTSALPVATRSLYIDRTSSMSSWQLTCVGLGPCVQGTKACSALLALYGLLPAAC